MKRYTDGNTQMANAVNKVYGRFAMPVENAFCLLARRFAEADAKDGLGQLDFITNDEGTLGFWIPTELPTYDVTVPSNYYSNHAMPGVAFGAGLSLVAVNQLAWALNEAKRHTEAETYSTMYHALFEFVFDLSETEGEWMDGVAVAGFID